MANLNKQTIMGYLGGDPIMRMTQGGAQVASFSVAVSERWTGKDGVQHEETTWFKVSAWNKLAEICATWLKKGGNVYIEGPIKLSKYVNKAGEADASLEIRADKMIMLGTKPGEGDHEPREARTTTGAKPAASGAPPVDIDDSEIPF
jgi:single-strand DNA-binding protein